MPNLLRDVDYAQFVGRQESQKLHDGNTYINELLSLVRGDQTLTGHTLPWPKTHNYVRIRPGEVSLWAGISGHGKSHLLGQVIADIMMQERCLIASMEIKPQRTLYYMLRQISGGASPSVEFTTYFASFTYDRLWIYDQIDTVETTRIIGMIWYAAQELGVKHIVIDSLMKCGMSDDDYKAQKEFVDHLCWAAKSLDIHIHLVAHIRKTENEMKMPGKWDVLGSSSITNLVDNVFIVHRNKRKELRAEQAMLNSDLTPPEDNEHDAVVQVAKQRHGEWEGNILLWFDKDAQSFTERPGTQWRHELAVDFLASKGVHSIG